MLALDAPILKQWATFNDKSENKQAWRSSTIYLLQFSLSLDNNICSALTFCIVFKPK